MVNFKRLLSQKQFSDINKSEEVDVKTVNSWYTNKDKGDKEKLDDNEEELNHQEIDKMCPTRQQNITSKWTK